ncbi:hypothetical protein BXZ70DRAFT_464708 [Cristinia sonorae]|uniref:Uncharacterized protein n=1 Tax=Cristinia sonorae TaxID=1940300 RepID=A0A8K0XMH0_9AGAR|nr:hypothetical protein BXZ70DRAFT_464708 [Cristinia sonorae]
MAFSLAGLTPSRLSRLAFGIALVASVPVLAQAPVNDVISWPSGLLLLASVLYAALGTNCETLWDIDPSIGPFIWSGLPLLSLSPMKRVNWVSNACHFVSGIRTANGKSNFWIRSEEVTSAARSEALRKVTSLIHPVMYEGLEEPLDETLWRITSAGLVQREAIVPISPNLPPKPTPPSARDFLLFAAIDYHVFRKWEVMIYQRGGLAFSTKGMPASSVVDVESEEEALLVVAAQMVRRPHSQSPLRGQAKNEGSSDIGPYTLYLDTISLDKPACAIDFHSYSPDSAKVSASLTELAGAYFRVVQYIKRSVDTPGWHVNGEVAKVSVGQTVWIAILGGALLDKGRLTIQNLPGRWGILGVSADEAYLSRIESILEALEPHVNTSEFFDLVFSGGTSRRSTWPFLIAGLCGQVIICYFLSVGTSAGVWTSVALSNSLYVGKLTDWHSAFTGKVKANEEPGLKMYVPRSPNKELMCIATLDRSPPKTPTLRPGVLLNLFGVAAAILGTIFQSDTRDSLGFGPITFTPPWVVYTSAGLSIGTSGLILLTIVLQQLRERTWRDHSELPQRWVVYTTLGASVVVSGLAVFFMQCRVAKLWPVLDAVTWLSGMPLGMLENGRMIAVDDNLLHLALLNRWIMGAVASSVGSSGDNGAGVCWK